MSALLGFFTALPEMVKLAQNIWVYVNKVSGNDPMTFLVNSNEAFQKLHKAESEQDYYEAAKALRDLIRHST